MQWNEALPFKVVTLISCRSFVLVASPLSGPFWISNRTVRLSFMRPARDSHCPGGALNVLLATTTTVVVAPLVCVCALRVPTLHSLATRRHLNPEKDKFRGCAASRSLVPQAGTELIPEFGLCRRASSKVPPSKSGSSTCAKTWARWSERASFRQRSTAYVGSQPPAAQFTLTFAALGRLRRASVHIR